MLRHSPVRISSKDDELQAARSILKCRDIMGKWLQGQWLHFPVLGPVWDHVTNSV